MEEIMAYFGDRIEAIFLLAMPEHVDIVYRLKPGSLLRNKFCEASHMRLLNGARAIGNRVKLINNFLRKHI